MKLAFFKNSLMGIMLLFLPFFAQTQSIDRIEIIPQNPNPQDSLFLVLQTTHPTSGCQLDGLDFSQSGNRTTVSTYFDLGMLTAICNSIDTIPVGSYGEGDFVFELRLTDSDFRNVLDSDSLQLTLGCPTPNADFSFDASDLSISFQNETQDGQSYRWDFGDGQVDTAANPTHQYADTGMYEVCLIAENDCGSDTICRNIQVDCSLPTANFSLNLINDSTLNFINNSSGAEEFYWDFGDDEADTVENPSHTYSDTGTFEICLVVENICGADTFCRSVSLSCPGPNVNFSHEVENLRVALEPDLQRADSVLWLLENEPISIENNEFFLDSSGTYELCIIGFNDCGTDTFCQAIVIDCPLPEAAFEWEDTLLTVEVTNLARYADSIKWQMNDRLWFEIEDFSFEVDSAGTYELLQIVYNPCGVDSFRQELNLTCPKPIADFSFELGDDGYNFIANAQMADSLYWTLGDGFTTQEDSFSHLYDSEGDYEVCLEAHNACGFDRFCDSVVVIRVPSSLEESGLYQVNVYPNPTQDVIHIERSEVPATAQDLQIRLMDMKGKLRLQESFKDEVQAIDLQHLSPGTYVLMIFHNKDMVAKSVVIKQ